MAERGGPRVVSQRLEASSEVNTGYPRAIVTWSCVPAIKVTANQQKGPGRELGSLRACTCRAQG